MLKYLCGIVLSVQFLSVHAQRPKDTAVQDWTHYVRTAGHGLNKNNIDATIKDAEATFLSGIQVDNDITGRYNSFLDPAQKLEDIKQLADRAHAIGNHAFVYVAGLECITENADTAQHSFFKDHPDWVQRNIDNKPAMFGGGDAFWISKGDEDVWISPYAPEWRKRYMELIRQIAATGIDGIWVDIPYWMTHFTGWENTWASFDHYTVEAFKKKTGLNAKKDLKLGDSTDENFRKWIDFRIETLTDFMAEITATVRSANPDCKVIPEIYPGIGEEAVRVGTDVYELYKVVDVVAHEYSGGGENAAGKNPQHWFNRMVGMYTFRAFAGDKATWMLSYSWGKENKVKPAEPMKNLALSNLMAGTNHYDARGHVMSGSNDIETRTLINKWIATNEKTFYQPRRPIAPIGVYFSPKTRNYFPNDFIESFEGVMTLMLQSHLEFQVVTPANLKEFKGDVLILPDVKIVSPEEESFFTEFETEGKRIIRTAADSGIGKQYSRLLKSDFDKSAFTGNFKNTSFYNFLTKFKSDLLKKSKNKPGISVEASPFISSQIASVDGKPHVFLANFAGLKSDEVVDQIPERNIRISFKAKKESQAWYLPFLGNKQKLNTTFTDGRIVCTLPPVSKGAVVWIE